jgi:hypothetical protein
MLKLEKVKKTAEISLILRPREGLFNLLFLKALSIALGLHLIAGSFFHIRHYQLIENPLVFPPVVVDADLTLSNVDVRADLESEELFSHFYWEPPETKPTLPLIPVTNRYIKPDFIQKEFALSAHLMNRLSGEAPAFEQVWFTGPESKKTMPSIELSGPLHQKILLDNGLNHVDVKNDLSEDIKIVYEVRLDTFSGTLFWFKPISAIPSNALKSYLEKILNTIQFEPESIGSIVSGEIAIALPASINN